MRPGATCDDIEAILEGERPRLVRLCARLAGSAESAEDLAQETLIEAWRHLHKLHEPAGYAAWLSAIARNVCRRWTAARRDENALALVSHDEEAAASIGGEPADPYDFETDLEQGELAELLDRALALLPAGTRAVLIKRYVDASPHAEIAAALGMTEGAVKVKVHRGKLALRRVLTTDLRVDAATFGIVDPDASPVQVTELWCPVCGKHRLEAQFGDEAADLRCPLCCASREVCIYGSLPVNAMRGHTALQAALRQQTQVIVAYFRAAMSGEQQRCTRCGRPLALPVRAMHTGLATYQDVCVFASACVFCESSCSISWRMLAQSRPEVWQFWQRHPRMYTLPPSEIETGGIEAVVTGFRSVNGRAGVDIITARDSLRVLGVHPVPGG